MFVFLLIECLWIACAENSVRTDSKAYSKIDLKTSTAVTIVQYGMERLTNGSLGQYNFLRSDCLRGKIINKLNQTTVLPSLTVKTPNPLFCLRGNGIGSNSSVYQSSGNIQQFISTIVSKKLGGIFTVDFWFYPNASMAFNHPNASMASSSEIFSLRYLGNSQPYFQVFMMNNYTLQVYYITIENVIVH